MSGRESRYSNNTAGSSYNNRMTFKGVLPTLATRLFDECKNNKNTLTEYLRLVCKYINMDVNRFLIAIFVSVLMIKD